MIKVLVTYSDDTQYVYYANSWIERYTDGCFKLYDANKDLIAVINFAIVKAIEFRPV